MDNATHSLLVVYERSFSSLLDLGSCLLGANLYIFEVCVLLLLLDEYIGKLALAASICRSLDLAAGVYTWTVCLCLSITFLFLFRYRKIPIVSV